MSLDETLIEIRLDDPGLMIISWIRVNVKGLKISIYRLILVDEGSYVYVGKSLRGSFMIGA